MSLPIDDPLTTTSGHMLWEWEQDLCDCPAKEWNGAAGHYWACSSTPIFAGMDTSKLWVVYNDIAAANLATTQTVIKCAECGDPRLGKDLLVIYQAPLGNTMTVDVGGFRNSRYKYPQNIVKAVCPHHNRPGKVSYQRPAPSGF